MLPCKTSPDQIHLLQVEILGKSLLLTSLPPIILSPEPAASRTRNGDLLLLHLLLFILPLEILFIRGLQENEGHIRGLEWPELDVARNVLYLIVFRSQTGFTTPWKLTWADSSENSTLQNQSPLPATITLGRLSSSSLLDTRISFQIQNHRSHWDRQLPRLLPRQAALLLRRPQQIRLLQV